MKKKNAFLIVVTIIVLLVGAIALSVFIKKRDEEKRLVEISNAYQNVNTVVFGKSENYYLVFKPDERTPDGVHSILYLSVVYYQQQTGAEFYYEDIVEYFSQEYEEDGSLRLYNNGLHPEMEEFVDWIIIYYEDGNTYINEIDKLHGIYFFEYRDEGFESSALYTWSRATLDELIKKEADPTYEMDLMSIQQRERAEAEAQETA